jgi:SAM-dependent methyltransferase
VSTITACRSCGSSDLKLVLSLGTTPLANALPLDDEKADAKDAAEPVFPLDLVFCASCTLLQITETVPPEILFRDYRYFSSFSDTMLRHAKSIADRMADELHLGEKSLAAEIASNDGYLLKNYVARKVPVLGIEPALNVAKVAEENGVRTLADFFGEDCAKKLAAEGKRADVLHANNVMAHVPDINGVVAGIARFLSDDGVFVMETPYAKDMLDHVEFDTIYHEHLFYYSLTAASLLMERHGLVVSDVERMPIHGGSLRLFVRHAKSAKQGPRVTALLAEEQAWGVGKLDTYLSFRDKVANLKSELVSLLRRLKGEGKRIAAYGAAAKGSTLVNHFGIGRDLVDFVVDRSTHKQGRRMPGVKIPIKSPDSLIHSRVDYALLLTWNFADEILAQQATFRAAGGKFIIPVPEVRVV